eukprot:jgi/Chrzof1/6412/Cz18g09220.t1
MCTMLQNLQPVVNIAGYDSFIKEFQQKAPRIFPPPSHAWCLTTQSSPQPPPSPPPSSRPVAKRGVVGRVCDWLSSVAAAPELCD